MNKEKEIKAFRKFLLKFWSMDLKKQNKLIAKVFKQNTQFGNFLNKIKDFNKEQQDELLAQYDNPEVNNWLWGL